MIKIPTIFKRDYSKTYQVLPEPNPECAWVFAGEGKVYRKWQGMAALIKDSQYYKRVIVKKDQVTPTNFIVCTIDDRSGKQFGWLPVNPELPQDQFYTAAYDPNLPDGTYELIGPKILGNPEKVDSHQLINHTAWEVTDLRRTYKDIKYFLSTVDFEGLVFHNSDGRMAKIKKKDFGMVR
jgi:hypothetical protein